MSGALTPETVEIYLETARLDPAYIFNGTTIHQSIDLRVSGWNVWYVRPQKRWSIQRLFVTKSNKRQYIITDIPLSHSNNRGAGCVTNGPMLRPIYLGGVYWRELGASRLFDEIAIRPTRYRLMGLASYNPRLV